VDHVPSRNCSTRTVIGTDRVGKNVPADVAEPELLFADVVMQRNDIDKLELCSFALRTVSQENVQDKLCIQEFPNRSR